MTELTAEHFAPVESLRDRALAILRQATVSGEIRIGEIYSATALARRLGVSVSPVREAMLTLVNEGIMEPVRNRGFQVVPMTDQDRWEIYDLRVTLEVPTMTKLAGLDVAERLAPVERLLDVMDGVADSGDVQEFLRLDREFHLTLLGFAGNERLTTLVGTLRDQTRLYGMQRLADRGELVGSAEEHRAIVAAIRAGDAAKTELLMRQHLGHIGQEWAGEE